MDLAELRGKHPDLYQEVFDAGRDAELARVCEHLDLAVACGGDGIAARGIRSGRTAKDFLPRYADLASKSAEKSATFVKARDQLLGTTTARASTATESVQPTASAPSPASFARPLTAPAMLGGSDVGDAVADMFDAHRGKVSA